MSLIIETGAIVPDANAYVDVAYVDAYWAQRADTVWIAEGQPGAPTTSAKEGAIIRATDYMEQVYRLLWKGSRRTKEQPLTWPRIGVFLGSPTSNGGYAIFDNQGWVIQYNEIPNPLKLASAELAKRALTTNLIPDLQPDDMGKRMEKIGPLETHWSGGRLNYAKFRAVEGYLQDIIERSPNSIIIQRA